MITVVQRSESDTASIGEGSPCCAGLLAALRPHAPVLKVALCPWMLRVEKDYVMVLHLD
jgi:hypothetical protein